MNTRVQYSSERPIVSLRVVRGGSESVSLNGKQFQVWPPGRTTLTFAAVVVALVALLYVFTLGRLTDYRLELSRQQSQLESYRMKVMELEANLIKAQEMVAKVARLAGVEFDYNPISLPRDSGAARIATSASMIGLRPGDRTIPFGLPLEGYISQLFEESHPGLDIAVGEGTPVLATASGIVTFSGSDPIYGLTVIVKHNDSISALYGHNSELLVAEGAPIIAGGRLALSGNTGRSSAPHLHYELRINGVAVDPRPFLGGVDYDLY